MSSNAYMSGSTTSLHDFFIDISELYIVKVKVPLFDSWSFSLCEAQTNICRVKVVLLVLLSSSIKVTSRSKGIITLNA